MYYIITILIILSIEGLSELCVNKSSIVHKKLVTFLNLTLVPAKIGDFYTKVLECGWCCSLWLSIYCNIYWLFTDYAKFYPFIVIATWRLANIYHTFNSILLRKKMIMNP